MSRKGNIMLALCICALSLSGLFGCGDAAKPGQAEETGSEVIDGGNTTRIDEDAPKEIASKEITGFDAKLFLNNRFYGDENHGFHFQIEQGADGVLTASEENTGVRHAADQTLLMELQDVIETYDLVSQNGVYDVTAGLPPEFEAYPFTVDYASGESLSFTKNNEPDARWGEAIYDIFASWFASFGSEDLYPEKETSLVTRIDLRFVQDDLCSDYGGIKVGEDYLLEKSLYRYAEGKEISDAYIEFPEDFYEKVTEILAGTDLVRNYMFSYYDHEAGNYGNHDRGYYGMGEMTTADGEADAEDDKLDLYIEFESGRRMNIETRKLSEIQGMKPLLRELMGYFDSLFE